MDIERNINKPEMEKVIATPYPFVSIYDLDEVVSRVARISPQEQKIIREAFTAIQKQFTPRKATYYQLSASAINKTLDEKLEMELARQDKTGVLILDRYIGREINANGNLFRLELSRAADGSGLTARPGSKIPVNEQVEQLISWVRGGQFDELLIVDDVLAFGDTSVYLIHLLQEGLSGTPGPRLRMLVGLAAFGGGWKGAETLKDHTGIGIEYLYKLLASDKNEWSSGMAVPASRDFTIFGGKILSEEDGKQKSVPYFLPFQKTVSSFVTLGREQELGKKFLAFNLALVTLLDQKIGRKLTLGDLDEMGFGIPTSLIPKVRERLSNFPSSFALTDFILEAEQILDSI